MQTMLSFCWNNF